MAIPDGKPATDFSAMNREWVRGVAAEAAAAEGLPSVSGSDNGKVLTVVSGEWEAATPSGGSGIPAPADPSDGDVLTYSSSDSAWVAAAPGGGGGDNIMIINRTDTLSAFTLDKTFAEIEAAVAGNIFCYVKVTDIDAESGYTEYGVHSVNSVIRNPDHGEHEPEFLVEAGSMSYTCASANAYPSHNF